MKQINFSKKIINVIIVAILVLSVIQLSKNIAISQTCEKNESGKWKVRCDNEGEKPCCTHEKFNKPRCKGDPKEPQCCHKKEDGTFKCMDDAGDSFTPVCSADCSSVDEDDSADTEQDSESRERSLNIEQGSEKEQLPKQI